MLDRIPHLQFFSQIYWNQMGDGVYGTIERAFRQYIADVGRLPDGGAGIRRDLYGELMLVLDSHAYEQWLQLSRTDIPTITAVGGRFIFPDEVRPLLAILDETFEPDA